MYVAILCSDIYFIVCFSYRQAAASDVSENSMRIPVINDSIDRATADHCTADFTGLVIEGELENYTEVKLEDAYENDTYSNVAKSVGDVTDECTSDFTSARNEVKLENCPDVNMEVAEENAMVYRDICVNVRVHAIHI